MLQNNRFLSFTGGGGKQAVHTGDVFICAYFPVYIYIYHAILCIPLFRLSTFGYYYR